MLVVCFNTNKLSSKKCISLISRYLTDNNLTNDLVVIKTLSITPDVQKLTDDARSLRQQMQHENKIGLKILTGAVNINGLHIHPLVLQSDISLIVENNELQSFKHRGKVKCS